MNGWQGVLVFVGIPSALVCLISLMVLRQSQARIPDGLAAAQRLRETAESETGAADTNS